jgi:hypothetical protein
MDSKVPLHINFLLSLRQCIVTLPTFNIRGLAILRHRSNSPF